MVTQQPLYAIAPEGKAHPVRPISICWQNGRRKGTTRCGRPFGTWGVYAWTLTGELADDQSVCKQCLNRKEDG